MLCKELEAVLAAEGLSPLPDEAGEHLAKCTSCQGLLADLSAIVATAKQIPAEVNPPERIFVAVRAQLVAEGIIREYAPAVPEKAGASWWTGIARAFRPQMLATVGATFFLVFGSVYLARHRNGGTATQGTAEKTASPLESQPAPVEAPKKATGPVQSARVRTPPQVRPSQFTELKPSPSESVNFADSAAVLSQTESTLPTRKLAGNAMVDASLRQNLRTLNEFIAECEARLRQNPRDQLTRDYLNMAYQQKAELLTAMMDSGGSEH